MKKYLITLAFLLTMPSAFAGGNFDLFNLNIFKNDTREIKSLLRSQVKYANKTDFDKFIATYDKDYTNADGFNLDTYSELVKDIWNTYDKIVYGIKIKSIDVKDDIADVVVEETSSADIPVSAKLDGVLRSESDSVYHLKKEDGEWKVASDEVLKETTTMLYGEAKNLDIKLTGFIITMPAVVHRFITPLATHRYWKGLTHILMMQMLLQRRIGLQNQLQSSGMQMVERVQQTI